MCLLIAAIKTFPSDAILKAAEDQNGHGGGCAWVENGLVHFKKGLKREQIKEILEGKTGPKLIHFRIATVGGISPELCHPFPITKSERINAVEGTANAVLGHNGHLNDWRRMMKNALNGEKMPDGPWSDTKAMAYLTATYGTAFLELVDEKVFVLKSNGECEIFGANWHEEEKGALYLSYNPMSRYCSGNNTRYGYTFDDTDYEIVDATTDDKKELIVRPE